MCPLKLDLSIDLDKIQDDCTDVISIIKPQWKERKLEFKPIKGGLANSLMLCHVDQDYDDAVVIRINGTDDIFANREAEMQALIAAQSKGIGAELLARFKNGIAYKYLNGDVLTVNNVQDPEIVPLLCDSIAKLHTIPVKPGSKPWTWMLIYKFLEHLPTKFEQPEVQERFSNEIGGKSFLLEETKLLEERLSQYDGDLVFCHNDIIPGNCILSPRENKVRLIDFEFADVNYRAYEIACHFTEYGGSYELKYEVFPDIQYQLSWVRKYLAFYRQHTGSDIPVTDSEVRELCLAANKFTLANHMMNIVWALYQVAHSSIDFNYMGFTMVRLKAYRERRHWLDKEDLDS